MLAPACALWLIALQRAVEPHGMPELRLDPVEVAEVMARDVRLLGSLQMEDPALHALDSLLLELGLAERAAVESAERYLARREALKDGLSDLIRTQGSDTAAALRARALARVEAAMAGRLSEDEIPAVMGGFANQLQRHGLLVDGRIIAPRFVVRTLYKARWNLAHSRANDHDMRPVEVRALHGWLGLHGTRLEVDARLAALRAYAEAGGQDTLEAQGILLYQAGEYPLAAEALQLAHDQRGGHLRIRNFALGARLRGRLDE